MLPQETETYTDTFSDFREKFVRLAVPAVVPEDVLGVDLMPRCGFKDDF